MADQVASFFVKFGADTGDLDRGMDRVSRGLNAFEQIATGAFRRVGELAINGVGKAIEGVGDIIAKGIDFNAMTEQAEIAFTTMLGDGEKAKAFLGDLKEFAAKTPFEFEDLTRASQRLLAMGISADKVLPTMTAVGDAVAGLGGSAETVNRVVTALGQMNAKGKASGEEMMQLTEAGIPAWEFLAKAIGKSIPDAMKEVSKGTVSAQVAIDAVTEGMEEKFGGMMEKQSHTWNGLLSNIQDVFGQVSGKVMKPLFDLLEKGLTKVVDFTSSDQFVNGIDNFVSNFTAGLDYVTSAISRFVDFFSVDIAIVTSGNASWGEKMLAVWDMLYTVGSHLLQSLVDGVIGMFPKFLDKLGEWGAQLWQWIVDNAPKALDKLGEWASGLWGWIVDNAPTWGEKLWEWAKATWQWIVDVTPIALAKLANLRDTLFSNMTAWAFGMGPIVSDMWNILSNIYMAGYGLITGQWDIFWSSLKNIVINFNRTMGPILAEWATAAWQWIVDVTPVAVGKLGEWAGALWGWIATNAPTWAGNLAKWGTAIWQWIVVAVPQTLTALGQWASGLWQWLIDNGPTWVGALDVWARAAWQWIADAAGPVVAALTDWGGAIWQWLATNGPTWVNTLAGWGTAAWGFIQTVGSVVSSIVTIFAPIATAVAKFLGWQGALIAFAGVLTVLFWPAIAAIGAFVVAWGPLFSVLAAAALDVALLRAAWDTDFLGIQTSVTGVLDYLGKSFEPLMTTISTFGVEALTEIANWATGTETDFTAVNAIVDSAKTVFEGLWSDFAEKFPATATVVEDAWKSVSDNTKIVYDYVTEKTSGLTQAITDFGAQSLTEIGKWVTGQETDFAATKTIWQSFIDTVTEIGNDFTTKVAPPIVEWFATNFPNATAETLVSMGILQDSWKIFNDEFSGAFTGMSTTVNRDWSYFWQNLKLTLETGVGLLALKTGVFVADLALSFAALHSAVNGDWDGMWTALGQIQANQLAVMQAEANFNMALLATAFTAGGTEIPKGFTKGLTTAKGDATGAVEDFAHGVSESFTRPMQINSPSRVFAGYGRNVVDGFDDGFTSRWNSFTRGAESMVSTWVNWFRNVFGIHSPSTLFEGYGTNIVAGLAKGIEGAQGMVFGAMDGLNAGLTANYSGSYAGSSAPVANNARMEQLLVMLIDELRNKNMSVTVNGGGGGSDIGIFHTLNTGLAG